MKITHNFIFQFLWRFSFTSLINRDVNRKVKKTRVALNNFAIIVHFEMNVKSFGRGTSYCRSIIHAVSRAVYRLIRFFLSLLLRSRRVVVTRLASAVALLFSSASLLARSKKKTPAKLRKCKLVRRHLPLQRPFPSGIKLCEEVVITESSRWHSERPCKF